MKRKIGLILGIGAVLIVAAVAMGAISAANPTDVKIGNETFHIPEGFREVNRTNDTTGTTVLFEKDNNTTIIINVAPNKNLTEISMVAGDVNKTIGGKPGAYNEKVHCFSYIHNGNYIVIFAHNESMIEEIVK